MAVFSTNAGLCTAGLHLRHMMQTGLQKNYRHFKKNNAALEGLLCWPPLS